MQNSRPGLVQSTLRTSLDLILLAFSYTQREYDGYERPERSPRIVYKEMGQFQTFGNVNNRAFSSAVQVLQRSSKMKSLQCFGLLVAGLCWEAAALAVRDAAQVLPQQLTPPTTLAD